MILSSQATAQLTIDATGGVQLEHNSNVYDLARGQALPPGASGNGFGDSDLAESAKLDASYLTHGQQFFATVGGSDTQYQHFTGLNHADYTFDGAWDWKAGGVLDGVLDVTRIRSMVSFYDLVGGSELVMQTEQRETAQIGLNITSSWRAEVTGLTHEINQPETGAPNLSLTESSGEAAFKFVGVAGLTSGVFASYLTGRFDEAGNLFATPLVNPLESPTYLQRSADLTVTDEISGLSTLRADAGYTQRTSMNSIERVSGVTGQLDYKRALTGKTSVELNASREINVYIANSGAEIDNAATVTVNWQATYKIGVALSYNYTYRELPNQGIAPFGSERVDLLNFAQLQITYQPVPWMIVKPYVQYQDRSSRHFADGDFNSNIAGLLFVVQWQDGVLAQRRMVQNTLSSQ